MMRNQHQLATMLAEILEQDIDDTVDVWPAVKERVGGPNTRQKPVFRFALSALFAVIITLGTVSAAVARSIFDREVFVDPGIDAILQSGLTTPIEQTQTIDGVHVTIHWVYADPVRVLVGYSTDAGQRERFRAGTTLGSLTLADGTLLQPIGGTGYVESDIQVATIASLPAPAGVADQEALDGTLALKVFDESAMLYIIRDEHGVALDDIIEMGTLTFDVHIPVTRGSVISDLRQVRVAERTLRLERLVNAPSGASIDVCFDIPDLDGYEWTIVGEIEAQGKTIHSLTSQASGVDPTCETVYFWEPLPPEASFYTIRLTEIIGVSKELPGRQWRIAGPWVFELDAAQ